MASPYQQQVFQRKLIYIGLILALFTGSWAWRRYAVDPQATNLSLREDDRGNEVELSGAVVRIGLLGSQGLTTCVLWNDAMEKQRKNQWNELKLRVSWLTRLQPHFITPWLFQSWNLAYNVSVESDRISDKYFYISEGINLLARGERQNKDHPDLRHQTGFYTQHKICLSDETNVQRSLFQLSCIPPHERDPARFRRLTAAGEEEFNWVEFEKFCRDHPQLIRRLRKGMHRETLREKQRLFTCDTPDDVVQFLEDNMAIASLYPPLLASSGVWDPNQPADKPLPPADRFPVLPPPHPRAFDPSALTSDSPLRDEVDAYAVAHAWFSYSQEPLPEPGDLPGSSKEIKDPTRQRKPKHMTTLIFRNYPAQARRYMAERLQQEGWYDEEDFDLTDWFEASKEHVNKAVKVGGGRKWSLDAWRKARDAWTEHGQKNHLLFEGEADEQTKKELGERFRKKYPMAANGAPPPLREDKLTAEEKRELDAARFMFELTFYRNVSNFMHHYNRCLVEAQEETVAARKLFFEAESQYLSRGRDAALRVYEERRKLDVGAWKDRPLNALEAWRELVLMRNKDFRHDGFIQEQTAEIQLRYLGILNAAHGRELKNQVAAVAAALPLVPKTTPEDFPNSLLVGPFDGTDEEGVPLIPPQTMETVRDRLMPGFRRNTANIQKPASEQGEGKSS